MDGKLYAVGALAVVILASACRPRTSELRARCAEANKNGVEFLAANQRDNGGFVTYVWRATNPERKIPDATVFTVSQVLHSLTFCEDNETVRRVRERAVSYLLAQREPAGIWRFFDKVTARELSPDVDDTSMAWAALKRSGHPIAADGLNAVRASRNETGLFNTWIGDPSTWKDIDSREIDPVVNLNVLLLFGLAQESIETVCHYVLAQADGGKFRDGSLYYASPCAFTHAFSRAYADGGVSCLASAVPTIRAATLSLQQSDGGWGDDLETARGLLTLVNLGYRGPALERGVNVILARQTSDGGWAMAPAHNGDARRTRYGSRCFTTAICLEALAKYRKH